MKRILALVLAAVMVCLAFASCTAGNTDNPTDTKAGEAKTDAQTDAQTEAKAESDLDYIKNKGKIIVGITVYEPMNYQDADGKWTGFDTEFAEAFAKKIGVDAEFIVIDWDNKFTELKSKSIDCIWNGMTITDEVKANSEASDPYVKNAQVVVMKSDRIADFGSFDSMKDLSFAAESGSAGAAIIKDANYNITEVTDMAAALLEVKSGSSDACVIDITMANAMTGAGTSYEDLGIACELQTEEYGVAFRQGSDVCAEFNKIMGEMMKDGTLDTLAEKYSLTLVK